MEMIRLELVTPTSQQFQETATLSTFRSEINVFGKEYFCGLQPQVRKNKGSMRLAISERKKRFKVSEYFAQ